MVAQRPLLACLLQAGCVHRAHQSQDWLGEKLKFSHGPTSILTVHPGPLSSKQRSRERNCA